MTDASLVRQVPGMLGRPPPRTMTLTARLGAARPHQDPARTAPVRASAAATCAATSGEVATRVLSTPATLTSTCGYRVITFVRSARGIRSRATAASRCSAVSRPSPVVACSEHDDVAGLLAAEDA
mgnify:CR=1 FL=1